MELSGNYGAILISGFAQSQFNRNFDNRYFSRYKNFKFEMPMQHVTPSTPSKNIFRYRGYMGIEFYQIYGSFLSRNTNRRRRRSRILRIIFLRD